MSAMQNSIEDASKRRHHLSSAELPVANTERRSSGNFKTLQAARAGAALLVVLFHVNHSIFSNSKYWPDQPFGKLMDFGHAGVNFFFVLSGFIIYAASRRDIGVKAKLGSFLWKRFRRIYPVYWVVLCLVIPIYFLMPSFGAGNMLNSKSVIDSAALVHLLGGRELLTVSWTLFHEIIFYAVFSVLIFNRRIGAFVLGLWFAASLVATVSPGLVPAAAALYVSPLHLLFGMGMVASWLVSRRRMAAPWLALAAGTGVFIATGLDEVYRHILPDSYASLLFGVGSTMILLGIIELERSGRLKVARCFVFLGDASYSIYLVHFVALSAFAKIALTASHSVAIPHSVIYVLLVSSSVMAGVVFHLVVEVPMLALLGQVSIKRVTQLLGMASATRPPLLPLLLSTTDHNGIR